MSLSDANNELLRVEDAAQHLGVDPVTVQQWCRDGALPCSRVGRSWRIRRSVLEESPLRQGNRSQSLVERLETFLERVMNSAEKPHWDADSLVSSVLPRSSAFRISKP